jgi:hypothetical protein
MKSRSEDGFGLEVCRLYSYSRLCDEIPVRPLAIIGCKIYSVAFENPTYVISLLCEIFTLLGLSAFSTDSNSPN